jgi:ferric-dicitrate binding protein FerR (iron transport regulator)
MDLSPMKSDAAASPDAAKLHPADWVVRSGAIEDVLDSLKARLTKRRRRRRAVRGAAALLIVAFVTAFWVVPHVRDTDRIVTLPGQRQTLTLADGSRVDLNARTVLATDFRRGRRSVRLDRGEAFFVVAQRDGDPFIVETPDGAIRVTGTEFNVRLPGDGPAEVTLMEGTVVLEPTGRAPAVPSMTLKPGDRAAMAGVATTVRLLGAAELGRVMAWREGRIVFDGEPLAGAVARYAEFHGVTIEVAPAVAALRVGGSYPLHDLQEFFRAVESTHGVRVLVRGERHYHVVPEL